VQFLKMSKVIVWKKTGQQALIGTIYNYNYCLPLSFIAQPFYNLNLFG
jgi:hypothetical protein